MTLPVICLIAVFFAWAPIAVMFARWGERESDRVDERENVGLDILNPRERSRNFDATEEQLYAFADMLEEAEPDEDIIDGVILASRPDPGPVTLEFGRITGTDPYAGYGPDERAPVIGQRQVRWAR